MGCAVSHNDNIRRGPIQKQEMGNEDYENKQINKPIPKKERIAESEPPGPYIPEFFNFELNNIRSCYTLSTPVSSNSCSALFKCASKDGIGYIRFIEYVYTQEIQLKCRYERLISGASTLPNLNSYICYGFQDNYFYSVCDRKETDETFYDCLVKKKEKLNETILHKILIEILQTLRQLHSINIVHGKINPDTIIFRDGKCFLYDVMTSVEYESDLIAEYGPYFFAPEMLKGEVPGKPADVWGLGATLLYIITGKHIYEETSIIKFIDLVKTTKKELNEPYFNIISKELKDLLLRMFEINPLDRITINEILESAWIKKKDLIQVDIGLDEQATQERKQLISIRQLTYQLAKEKTNKELQDILMIPFMRTPDKALISLDKIAEETKTDPKKIDFWEQTKEITAANFIVLGNAIALRTVLRKERIKTIFLQSKTDCWITFETASSFFNKNPNKEKEMEEIKNRKDIFYKNQIPKQENRGLNFNEFFNFCEEAGIFPDEDVIQHIKSNKTK